MSALRGGRFECAKVVDTCKIHALLWGVLCRQVNQLLEFMLLIRHVQYDNKR